MTPLLWLLIGISGTCSVLSLSISWFSYLRPAPERQAWDRHATWMLSVAVVVALMLVGALLQSSGL